MGETVKAEEPNGPGFFSIKLAGNKEAGGKPKRVTLQVRSPKEVKDQKTAPLCILFPARHVNSRLNLYMNEPNGIFLSGSDKHTQVHIIGHYLPVPPPKLYLPTGMEGLEGIDDEQLKKLLAGDLLPEEDEDDDEDFADEDEEGTDDSEDQKGQAQKRKVDDEVTPIRHAGKKPMTVALSEKDSARPREPPAKKTKVESEPPVETSKKDTGTNKIITTPSGLQYKETIIGDGAKPKLGRNVTVRYTLRLKSGRVVDKSGRAPFKFRLGVGEVIKGWDEGLKTMRCGGQRHLIVPPSLGYGKRGAPPDIPGNATLLFDVELVKAM